MDCTNKIAVPRSEEEVEKLTENFFKRIAFDKDEKLPSGVNYYKSEISVSRNKQYREGKEYLKLKTLENKKNIAIVMDVRTSRLLIRKQIMRKEFRKKEISCWLRMITIAGLTEEIHVPKIYLALVQDDSVLIFMELLEKGITLQVVIDDQLPNLRKTTDFHDGIKAFSLYVFDKLLNILAQMHRNNVTHTDLHSGNILVQKGDSGDFKVKIIDFGIADEFKCDRFRKDICEILRIFCGLYTGQEFNDINDLRKKSQKRLEMVTKNWSEDDRTELVNIVNKALEIDDICVPQANLSYDDIKSEMEILKKKVQSAYKKAIDDAKIKKSMEDVVEQIFINCSQDHKKIIEDGINQQLHQFTDLILGILPENYDSDIGDDVRALSKKVFNKLHPELDYISTDSHDVYIGHKSGLLSDIKNFGKTVPYKYEGPKGCAGEAGVKGPNGEQGNPVRLGKRGKEGSTGAYGLKGTKGEEGRSGISGLPTFQGDRGDKGYKGVQGDPGPMGIKGDLGGGKGLRGLQGLEGPRGPKGLTGLAGLSGDVGPKGFSGPVVLPGVDGNPGEPGLSIKDDKGQKGEPAAAKLLEPLLGDHGDPGPVGLPGMDGLPGLNGPKGSPGFPGEMGHHGEPGVMGIPGRNGLQDENGTKGGQCVPGEDGFPGRLGEPGRPGPDDYQASQVERIVWL